MELRARTAEQIVAGANPADAQFRLLVESVADYAIFLLDTAGRVASWNPGAERIISPGSRPISSTAMPSATVARDLTP